MNIKAISVKIPEGCNIILGQTHFIKTAEDLYEILVTAAPHGRFGIAFAEASGPCLIRTDGNDDELIDACAHILQDVGAGHVFCILLRNVYPITVLNQIKSCQEVCTVYCATANPLDVLVASTGQGNGVVGVVDGFSPRGIETAADKEERRAFLRNIGYKR